MTLASKKSGKLIIQNMSDLDTFGFRFHISTQSYITKTNSHKVD